MSKDKGKKSNPDGLNLLASLFARMDGLEEAIGIHENRLNNLSIPPEVVNTMSIQTLRMLGQILIAVTEPQQAQQPEATPVQEEAKEEVAL